MVEAPCLVSSDEGGVSPVQISPSGANGSDRQISTASNIKLKKMAQPLHVRHSTLLCKRHVGGDDPFHPDGSRRSWLSLFHPLLIYILHVRLAVHYRDEDQSDG